MRRNIEIKARANDWNAQIKKAKVLTKRSERIIQEDTFFKCKHGHLKLRIEHVKHGYLIFYSRSNKVGPKFSGYEIYPVRDPLILRKALAAAFGEKGTIRKKRIVYHVGQTRIHFDEVKGLGRFIEIEVVLKPNQSQAQGRRIAGKLIKALGINKKDMISCSYVDMVVS
ncbi:class IV adenylate cyclase [Elusimicrobiota bacterium]